MSHTYLIYGATGWIGGMLMRQLESQNSLVVASRARLENLSQIQGDLDSVKPTHVLMAAGVTGRPNVDWCETNRDATLMANVVGLLNVAHACSARGIHCTVFGTGCVYEYDETHPVDSGIGFSEQDPPNFAGSFYSRTKAMAQTMLTETYGENLLLFRLRMPISDDLHERSFVTKIANYERVVDVPNSVTVLRELLPIALGLAAQKATGVYNLVNPGTVSHNEVLALYRKHVSPDKKWSNMSLEEQSRILVAGRSNTRLDTAKIEAAARDLGLPLNPAWEAVTLSLKRMRQQLPLDWNMES